MDVVEMESNLFKKSNIPPDDGIILLSYYLIILLSLFQCF